MRRNFVFLFCFMALCGCRRSKLLPADVTSVLQVLQTNSSVRAIVNSRVLLERARAMESLVARREMIRMWRDALLAAPVESVGAIDESVAIREICETLNWHVVGAMQESGCSYEEAWSVIEGMVSWLDRKIASHDPKTMKRPAARREAIDQWRTYQFLSEMRENLVENIEVNWLDVRRHPEDGDKIKVARERLATLIDRPVRSPEAITSLGFYTKQVSRRIQKERDAALAEMEIK